MAENTTRGAEKTVEVIETRNGVETDRYTITGPK